MPFVGLDSIDPNSTLLSNVTPFSSMRSAANGFCSGQILYSRLRPYLNKVWLADRDGACSGEFIVMEPRPDILSAYLLWLLHHNRFVAFASHAVTGDRPRTDFDSIARYPVPVPPTDIQNRIVTHIDELFAELDDGEAALSRARAGLETYRKSLLKAAVTGELTADWREANPPEETGEQLLQRILDERRARWDAGTKSKGKAYRHPEPANVENLPSLPPSWTYATLPQLGDFGRGKSKHRPRNDPKLYGGPYPFVQTGVVANSGGRITTYDQTYSDMGLAQSKLWPARTLCITIAANIAKTGVLEFAACFPDSIVGLTCADGIDAAYIEYVIRSVQEDLERYAPATAQKNINLEVLEQVALPLPPLAEQQRIVSVLNDMLSAADQITRDQIDHDNSALRQSILNSAFRGELVQ